MIERVDRAFLLAVLFMMGLGLVQVYSSSYVYAVETYGTGLHFFLRQLLFTGLALIAMFAAAFLPWKINYRLGICLAFAAVLGIALTFVPGVGVKAGGAGRWIQLPLGFRLEPAELFKVSLPFLIAHYFLPDGPASSLGRKIFKHLIFAIPFVLLLKQPDFGSFALGFSVGVAMLFVYGLRWIYIFAGTLAAIPAFYLLIWNVPYRLARVKTYLDPWADPSDRGFQVIQSLLGFHSGGVWGAGLGQGQGKLFFLPEAHTDFTLSVLGEELGFVGFFLVMMIYAFLVFRGMQTASQSQDREGRAVALGLTVLLALSILINVGVALGMLPTKGLTLPFLSYGGSSLVCTGLAMGWLLNIRRQSNFSPKKEAVRLTRL